MTAGAGLAGFQEAFDSPFVNWTHCPEEVSRDLLDRMRYVYQGDAHCREARFKGVDQEKFWPLCLVGSKVGTVFADRDLIRERA